MTDMKKQAYTAPQTRCYQVEYNRNLLAGSNTQGAWTPAGPDDPNPQPPIDIKDETGGNLGEEGSEISGAKGNNLWTTWEE
ncbi:MAG TPA: hypothetical protein DD401_02685 [Prevotella sp.]|nr:hypothetical protein [Prevotella sp.]